MFAVRSLIMVVMMTSTHVFSETFRSECMNFDWDKFKLIQGEAFHVVHSDLTNPPPPDSNFTWYKMGSHAVTISSDETNRIHHHGPALFLFDLLPADSGDYIAQEEEASGKCYNYGVRIEVFDSSFRGDKSLLSGSVSNPDANKQIDCPVPVVYTCKELKGSYSWYKDSSFLRGKNEATLRIREATNADQGVYTCVCTWTHNGRSHNSSGSREMIHQEQSIYRDAHILLPTVKEQFADKGCEITLKCSFICGINVIDLERDCSATWNINGNSYTGMDGYNQTVKFTENRSKETIVTAFLTIEKVSARDFSTEFKCVVENPFVVNSTILTLKPRASIIPLAITGCFVLLFFVFAAMLVKYFAINITLFFRPYIPLCLYSKDTRKYDAYVVYPTQKMDPATEDTLSQFITINLPNVLERKCGYRLFIHGRDDIPGEDHVETVEYCMSQSRRLIAILTPGSGSQSPTLHQPSGIEGFDWQVGLHHALMQREMNVILIQLGQMELQGYTHLPLGLQHLIRKSAPIRWSEESLATAAWNSRFWKRVRYLMPAKPAARCTKAAIV